MVNQIRVGAVAVDTFKSGSAQTSKIFLGTNLVFESVIFGAPDFVSSQFTPAIGTLFTATHGLGGKPILVTAELVCLVANNGYSVGDTLPWLGISSNDQTGIHVTRQFIGYTDTEIFIIIAAGSFDLSNRSTGASFSATNTDWALELKAWKDSIPAPDFTSSNFGTPVANDFKNNAAHGLGLTPKMAVEEFECTTAEFNYSVGDVIQYNHLGIFNSGVGVNTGRSIQLGYNSTDVFSLQLTGNFMDKITGANAGFPTDGNWTRKLKVWNLPAPNFKSSGITPVAGSTIVAAHSLSNIDFMMGEIVCVTAEKNWVVGDRMPVSFISLDSTGEPDNTVYGHVTGYDSTDAFFAIATNGFELVDRNTPVGASTSLMTFANWEVELSLWGS